MSQTLIAIFIVGLLGVVLVVGLAALGALITWAVWNALVPSLLSGPHITFFQAFLVNMALSIIGNLVFRS